MTDIIKQEKVDLIVTIEKTELAKSLEESLSISWELSQHFPNDAGYDLRACIPNETIIPYGRSMMVPTGLKFHIRNPNYEMQVRPRSGLAAKFGLTVVNSPGTVDHGYRDEVICIMHNLGRAAFPIKPGDRIAQACFRWVPTVAFTYEDKIKNTGRGGFGSSGVA